MTEIHALVHENKSADTHNIPAPTASQNNKLYALSRHAMTKIYHIFHIPTYYAFLLAPILRNFPAQM